MGAKIHYLPKFATRFIKIECVRDIIEKELGLFENYTQFSGKYYI